MRLNQSGRGSAAGCTCCSECSLTNTQYCATTLLFRSYSARYLSGFFIFDLVSIVPFEEILTAAQGGTARSTDSGTQALRVVRLVRLTKLLRIIRASRLFERFEETLNVRYGCVSHAMSATHRTAVMSHARSAAAQRAEAVEVCAHHASD